MKNLEQILDEAVRRGLTEALQVPRGPGAKRSSTPDESDPRMESVRPIPKEPLASLP